MFSACGAISGNRGALQRQSSRPPLGHHLAARAAASPRLWLATGAGDWPARMLLASRAGRRGGGRRARDKLDGPADRVVARRPLRPARSGWRRREAWRSVWTSNLDDQFHETHPIGCHHSSLVSLACRSYILVIRSWSAYDSNHGSARLVAPLPSATQAHDPVYYRARLARFRSL